MKKAFYLALLVPAAGLLSACSYFVNKADPRTQVRTEMEDVLEDFVVPEAVIPTVYTAEMKDPNGPSEADLVNMVKTSYTGIPLLAQGQKVKSLNLKYVTDKKTSLLIQIDRTLSAKNKEVNRSASIELTHEDGSPVLFANLNEAQKAAALKELDLFSRILICDDPEVFAKSVSIPVTMMINVNTGKPVAELNETYIDKAACNVYKVACRDLYSGKTVYISVTSDSGRFFRQIVFPGLSLLSDAGKVTITAPDYAFIAGAWVPATLKINDVVYKLVEKESQVTMAPGFELPVKEAEEEEESEEKIDKDEAANDSAKEDAEQAAEEKTEAPAEEETPAE